MSRRAQEEGDGLVRVLAVTTEPGSGLGIARSAQQTDGGITQHGTDGRPCTDVYQTRVFSQVHILAAMPAILSVPVAAFERQQVLGRPDLGREAGDAVAHLLMPCAGLPPEASELEDLRMPWQIQLAHQIGGGDQGSALRRAPIP